MNTVIEHMLSRRSVRKYRPEPVPKELMDQVILAGTDCSGYQHRAAQPTFRAEPANRRLGGGL